MNQFVCQGQICQCIFIHIGVEVIVVAGEGPAEAVIQVKHAGDAIEPESIHPVFIPPEPAVGEQEMAHGVLQAGELEKVTVMHFREYETASQEIMQLDFDIEADQKKLVPVLHYNGLSLNAGFVVERVLEERAKGQAA